MSRPVALALLLIGAAGCQQPAAPPPPAPPPSRAVADSIRSTFEMVKEYLTKSIEMVRDDQLAFKPRGTAGEVRTFGQIVGHLADANYLLCGPASGESVPAHDFEHTAKTRAELQKALGDALAFCDRAFAAIDDVKGAEPVDTVVGRSTRLGALAFNNSHDFEHYGNLVTYMRAAGMVPPSSQGR